MKKPQEQFVLEQLKLTGEISRNFCLRNYISRLGAIICKLKKDGYKFYTYRKGGDYVYSLLRADLGDIPIPTQKTPQEALRSPNLNDNEVLESKSNPTCDELIKKLAQEKKDRFLSCG